MATALQQARARVCALCGIPCSGAVGVVVKRGYYYGMNVDAIAFVMGVTERSVYRWWKVFDRTGDVERQVRHVKYGPVRKRWPQEVCDFILEEIKDNPGVYIEELVEEIKQRYPELRHVSVSTLMRVLRVDLNLSRKVMTHRAQEAKDMDIKQYYEDLRFWYGCPEQLVFIDEASKDARAGHRTRGWSTINTPSFDVQTFERGKRLSVLAAFTVDGFIDWTITGGTFTRNSFHRAFMRCVWPHLHPWPGPQSIVVLDNPSIHRYRELSQVCGMKGALLIYLPPYCPQLAPIEVGFGLLRRWLQQHCTTIIWKRCPHEVLDIAMRCCTDYSNVGSRVFHYCGYGYAGRLGMNIGSRMRTRVRSVLPYLVQRNEQLFPGDLSVPVSHPSLQTINPFSSDDESTYSTESHANE